MGKVFLKEFKSISEFNEYLNNTPLNNLFRWEKLESSDTSRFVSEWCQTQSFEDASKLLKEGWENKAKELEQRIKLESKKMEPKTKARSQFDVVGFQASVPRYLQGIPTSMVNKKQVPVKQKVITIVKHIGYRADIEPETILENSVKALMIVKKLEEQGYRINLDVISPASVTDLRGTAKETLAVRIRIKSANERLNISKIAFPMVHPSMLRRMIFRFREVFPEIKEKLWVGSYGTTVYDIDKIKKDFLKEGEFYLHNFIEDVDKEISRMKLS